MRLVLSDTLLGFLCFILLIQALNIIQRTVKEHASYYERMVPEKHKHGSSPYDRGMCRTKCPSRVFICTCVLLCILSGIRGKASRSTAAAMDSVATVDSVGDFSLQKTISNIEQRLNAAPLGNDDDDDDDVMPAVANEMGAGQYVNNADDVGAVSVVAVDDDAFQTF